MAHFAQIDANNKVVRVLRIADENEADGENFIVNTLGLVGRWIQTSYNTKGGAHSLNRTPLRKNYAGIGYTYDPKRDAFLPPQPFPSWVLNEQTCTWMAPVEKPPEPTPDGRLYFWDESSVSWKLIPR